MPVFSLAIHADYRCRHSGACCSTDWDVPVELAVYRRLNAATAAGQLGAAAQFIIIPPPPDRAAAILRREQGTCVLFDRDTHLCQVHRDVGEDALPSACRFFPRIALTDVRGTFITLSHYCPTAAAMLFREDVPLEIVEDPHAFAPGEYEGLVAVDALPPLLHPRMLMDLEAYSAWERHALNVLASPSATPESGIATLARDAGLLGEWQPGGRSLREAIETLPDDLVERPVAADLGTATYHYAVVAASVPEDLRPARLPEDLERAYQDHVRAGWTDFRMPITRFLGAHAFANWGAYQGRGLRTFVRSLDAALAVLSIECSRQCAATRRRLDRNLLLAAFRASDFLLRHLASREALARAWAEAETVPGSGFKVPRSGSRSKFVFGFQGSGPARSSPDEQLEPPAEPERLNAER